jgi:hypothetical protein
LVLYKRLSWIWVAAALGACTSPARLITETPQGGTVVYAYIEERDILSSSNRQAALALIDRKCQRGHQIVREGQVPRVTQAVDKAWQGQMSRDGQVSLEKDWAIQFACK